MSYDSKDFRKFVKISFILQPVTSTQVLLVKLSQPYE